MDAIFQSVQQWLDANSVASDSLDLKDSPQHSVDQCLEFLALLQNELHNSQRSEIIAISLQDMQMVNKLVKLVVFYGICPYLEPNFIVFHTAWPVPQLADQSALEANVGALVAVLKQKNDLSDVVRLTEFLPFVVAGAAQTDHLSGSPRLFSEVSSLVGTFELYKIYVRMLSNKASPAWLQQQLAQSLSLLPYTRPDALRAMIELFTGYREHEQINIKHMESLVDIFVNPPTGKQQKEHIKVMDAQLLSILSSLVAPPDITTAACYLCDLIDSRLPQALMYLRNDFIAALTTDNGQLEPTLMALTNLCERKRASKLVNNVLQQALPMLWLIFVHLCQSNTPNGSLLKLLVGICAEKAHVLQIVDVALIVDVNGLQPVVRNDTASVALVHTVSRRALDFSQIEVRVAYLVTLLNKLDSATITWLFVELLRQALSASTDSSLDLVLKLKLIERMGQDFKTQLFSNPTEIVDLALSVLSISQNSSVGAHAKLEVPSSPQDSDDEESEEESNAPEPEMVSLCIDLLNSIILECFDDAKVVAKIRTHATIIKGLCSSTDADISAKALYTCKLLESINDEGLDLGDDKVDYNDSAQVLAAAKQSLVDPLPPVKAHGLQLVRKLVQRKDPILDMGTALQLAKSSLGEEDSYIYLNAVKTIEQCAQTFGINVVVPTVVEWYNDPKLGLDMTLRIGEVLGRIVQSSTSTFALEVNALVLDALLHKIRVQSRQDDRVRVSAMSLLGLVVAGNPHAAYKYREKILDCCLGVLKMEKDAPMQRSALVILLEYIGHINSGTLSADPKAMDLVRTQVKVSTGSSDEVVSSYAKDVLAMMNS